MQLFIVKAESLVITNEYVVVNWTLSSVHSARHMLGAFEVRSNYITVLVHYCVIEVKFILNL
jgi:hypothetical protein